MLNMSNSNQMRRIAAVATLVFMIAFPCSSIAKVDRRSGASICERAALAISQESGVPLEVLRAISLTETGRKNSEGFLPWPWTVNMEGAGKWFDTRGEAQAYVDRHFARGARSFDVGCFQINYRWHGHAFQSVEEMFDPMANARYAASFLGDLYNEFGDWTKAAGAYHSRTPKFANKYAARFERIRSRLSEVVPVELVIADVPQPTAPLDIIARVNRYPLLQQGSPARRGSLVQLNDHTTGRLINFASPKPLVEAR
jgi:hypothetical protein